jgi:hypothetical protein
MLARLSAFGSIVPVCAFYILGQGYASQEMRLGCGKVSGEKMSVIGDMSLIGMLRLLSLTTLCIRQNGASSKNKGR